MKRIIIPGLMLAAAFALTNCTEQLVTPFQEEDVVVDETAGVTSEDGEPYEVYVESIETKTVTQNGKTFWLKGDNYTSADKISLWSAPKGASSGHLYHKAFTYVGDGKFGGSITGGADALSAYNDWYAIYPFNSSSAGTLTAEKVTLGAPVDANGHSVQCQAGASNRDHIDGGNYPIYGIKNNVAKTKSPKFKMSPLFSLIALEIVNNAEGAIVVANAEFKATEDIVGEFDANILGTEKSGYLPVLTPVPGKTSQTARLELSSPISIAAGSSATLYFAVKPFEVQSGKELIISLNGTASKGNGVSKAVKMEANTKFEGGMMTKFTVPVEKLSFGSTVTNVMNLQGTVMYEKQGLFGTTTSTKTDKMICFDNVSETTVTINGEKVTTYIVGSESAVGKITLKGTPKQMIQLMPIEFYASSWYNSKSVMRLDNLKVGINLLLGWKTVSRDFAALSGMMDPNRIKFKGIVPSENHNGNVLILDEEPFHKKVDEASAESLLIRFDDDKTDDKVPTYKGLYDALTDPSKIKVSGSEANITATIIYNKISPIMKNVLGSLSGAYDLLFSEPYALFNTIKDYPFEVTLATVAKGTDDATDNRAIIWGLHSKALD